MMYQIFSEARDKNPNTTALVFSNGDSLSYQALDCVIHQWAYYLQGLGIGSNDNVAVMLDDEDYHVIIFLALDYLNATYVPFDRDVPKQQLVDTLELLNPKKIIIDKPLDSVKAKQVSKNLTELLDASKIEQISEYLTTSTKISSVSADPESISYIVSSSGTTGKKKGIPIKKGGFRRWADELRSKLDLKENDAVLVTRSPGYDARIFEYLEAFSSGSTLSLISREQRRDLKFILEVCKKRKITALLFIASQVGLDDTEQWIKELAEAGVKHLLVTGDACTAQLKALCEKYGIFLWNCYGSTEETFGFSMFCVNGQELLMHEGELKVPIGLPYGEEVTYRIIDGILWVASPYLTPGYSDDHENELYFKEIDGVRFFNTNDKFCEQDGHLYYLGRADHKESHHKINGVKVNESSIEACINAYRIPKTSKKIQAAVVIKSYLGQPKPFAYAVLPEGFENDETMVDDFTKYLNRHLLPEERPIIMPVKEILRMETSDKIDYATLRAQKDDVGASFNNRKCSGDVRESTALEKKVHEIWQQVFHVEETIRSNLEIWELGTSVEAAHIVHLISELLDPEYTIQTMLRLNSVTIDTITESLAQKHSKTNISSSDQALIHHLKIHEEAKEGNLFLLPPLLGNGLSYKSLADSLKFAKNIYALSDPSVANEHDLPRDMAHAVSRYIAAIRSKQAHGPYQLLGFSFGATLAYYVAEELEKQRESISKIHLVDGFPPMLYQALDSDAQQRFERELLKFLLPVLNNHVYKEELLPVHVESGFNRLRKQLKHPESHALLNIAERHLYFMKNLPIPIPQKKLNFCPTIYLTKPDQSYWNILRDIGWHPDSADFRYDGWHSYFSAVRRSAVHLFDAEHSDVLKNPTQPGNNPSRYFERADDFVFNLDAILSVNRVYQLQKQTSQLTLTVFFLSVCYQHMLHEDLLDLDLDPTSYFHKEEQEKDGQLDALIDTRSTLTCFIPLSKEHLVRELLKEYSMYDMTVQLEEHTEPTLPEVCTRKKEPYYIDLYLRYNFITRIKFTFTINVDSCFSRSVLSEQLQYEPEVEGKERLMYFHELRDGSGQSIREATLFVARFINLLKPMLQSAEAQRQTYPKRHALFQLSPLDVLCEKYRLPDQSVSSLEKGLRDAAVNNRLQDIKIFLQEDIDINAADSETQKTALHWASSKGWRACVDYLLVHSADANLLDASGHSSAMYIEHMKNNLKTNIESPESDNSSESNYLKCVK
ncbi:MAG: AMP-binding protein [Gammaproteobacteria bacterium]|nr:AMP-binding protein [Gammaproteobacteria bacterium]